MGIDTAATMAAAITSSSRRHSLINLSLTLFRLPFASAAAMGSPHVYSFSRARSGGKPRRHARVTAKRLAALLLWSLAFSPSLEFMCSI